MAIILEETVLLKMLIRRLNSLSFATTYTHEYDAHALSLFLTFSSSHSLARIHKIARYRTLLDSREQLGVT